MSQKIQLIDKNIGIGNKLMTTVLVHKMNWPSIYNPELKNDEQKAMPAKQHEVLHEDLPIIVEAKQRVVILIIIIIIIYRV